MNKFLGLDWLNGLWVWKLPVFSISSVDLMRETGFPSEAYDQE